MFPAGCCRRDRDRGGCTAERGDLEPVLQRFGRGTGDIPLDINEFAGAESAQFHGNRCTPRSSFWRQTYARFDVDRKTENSSMRQANNVEFVRTPTCFREPD